MCDTLRKAITSKDKTLREVFNETQSYYIDIYQREYKWTIEQVETLLYDIEVRFNAFARNKQTPQEIQNDVKNQFEPYFLNTFLTHHTNEGIFIVDGQQRLTTFLLIFISLLRILKEISKDANTFSAPAISKLIYESDDFGQTSRFKIHNPNREEALNHLLSPVENFLPKDETQKNILENFKQIFEYLNKLLKNNNAWDIIKITYYIAYLLDKLLVVEIKIETNKDVAMVFEVINDRGLPLKPHEILKGKLIGNLETTQREKANEIWTQLQNKYYEKGIDFDDFFKVFFRAKFADSEQDYEKFEEKYHYELYRNKRLKDYFDDFNDPKRLFDIVERDIRYFANIYIDLKTSCEKDYEYVVYNRLLNQDQQYLLILSNLKIDDPEKNEKIKLVSQSFDQFHTTIRLLKIYDSNRFQRSMYELNHNIREKDIDNIKKHFDNRLIKGELEESTAKYETTEDVLNNETLFNNISNTYSRFTKYVLMRIDRFLSHQINRSSYAAGDLKKLEDSFNKFDRKRYGMHLEHIYTKNEVNYVLFTKNGSFDEGAFNETREKFGALLLLKDKHNLSSGNDIYEEKQNIYETSDFIWNEILVGFLNPVEGCGIRATGRVFGISKDSQISAQKKHH